MEVVIYSRWEEKGRAGYGGSKISFSEIFNIVQCSHIKNVISKIEENKLKN